MKVIQKYYSQMRELTKKDESSRQTHSIDESAIAEEIKKDGIPDPASDNS